MALAQPRMPPGEFVSLVYAFYSGELLPFVSIYIKSGFKKFEGGEMQGGKGDLMAGGRRDQPRSFQSRRVVPGDHNPPRRESGTDRQVKPLLRVFIFSFFDIQE